MNRSRYTRWLTAAVAILVCASSLAACSPTTAAGGGGHLTGVVYTKGGKNAETNPAEAKLTATPTSGGVSKTYTTQTASDGSFTLDLPAGTYELTGTLTTRIPGGQTGPQEVTIIDGRTTNVEVFAIYP